MDWFLYENDLRHERANGGVKNIVLKHYCFFFTLEEIKRSSNLAASSDFAVTGKRMIIWNGNYIFSIAIISLFRTEFCIQHCFHFVFTNYTEHPQPY